MGQIFPRNIKHCEGKMNIGILIDTETTGFKEAAMIEYGRSFINFCGESVITSTKPEVFRYNPQKNIDFGAMATHGIIDEDLYDCPPVDTFSFDALGAQYLIGHNISFDWKNIGEPNIKQICTLKLARKVWPDRSHKLLALVYSLDRQYAQKMHRTAHGVAGDIEMTAFVLQQICLEMKYTSFEQMYEACNEIAAAPMKMPFGAHKGTLIKDLPIDYINWALSNLTNLNSDIKAALEAQQKEKA